MYAVYSFPHLPNSFRLLAPIRIVYHLSPVLLIVSPISRIHDRSCHGRSSPVTPYVLLPTSKMDFVPLHTDTNSYALPFRLSPRPEKSSAHSLPPFCVLSLPLTDLNLSWYGKDKVAVANASCSAGPAQVYYLEQYFEACPQGLHCIGIN